MSNQPTAPPPSQVPRLNLEHLGNITQFHGLISAYRTARDNYLSAVSYHPFPLPPCLDYPWVYFYSRKGHRNLIYTYQPFLYGTWYSKKVSKRTFPSMLRYCNIPDGPPDLRDALFDAMLKLVQDFPYSERDTLMQELWRTNQSFAEALLHVAVSSEHNLFLPAFLLLRASHFQYAPMLSVHFSIPPSVSKAVAKRYLSIVSRGPTEREYLPQWEVPLSPKSVLFYSDLSGLEVQSLSYHSGFVTANLPAPVFPVKMLPYLNVPDQVPPGAADWLFHLTGGDTELVNRLAELLARAASPVSSGKNMTVICTRENPDVLKALLSEALSPLVLTSGPRPSSRAGSSLPSLNQFCRISGLTQLYFAQGAGQGVAFVRDIEVSDTARPVLNKLLAGKPVALSPPGFPKQYLYCKTHFICISQDPQRARSLSRSLRVNLIDLSAYEIPLRSPPELSAKDAAWLRSVFLPHGLTELKTAAKPEKAPAPSDWVYEFLSIFCSVDPGSMCHREDLYTAYAAYYRHTHPGLEPPLTQGRFVKAVKPYLEKGAFRHVSYRKIRSEQKMYFVGLACPAELPAPAPAPDKTHTDAFTAHLEAVHSARPRFSLTPNIQAKVRLPSGR